MDFWYFTYRKSFYLTHPWIWLSDFFRSLKYAFQRFYRGWDETVTWSLDMYLSTMLPIWLKELKDAKAGIPMSIFTREELDTLDGPSDAVCLEASNRWDTVLDEMISGFDAARRISTWSGVRSQKNDQALFERSMDLLKEHYFSLWD